jgi:hypothetical protein
VKRNLLAVSAINKVHIPDESSVLLIVHEDIYSDTANHSLLSGHESTTTEDINSLKHY